jgi:epoxide hydrolase
MSSAIRPLKVSVDEESLIELRDRLRRTRFPEKETVGSGTVLDWSQGVPLAYLKDVATYWEQSYDWRRVEAELNAHGQALTEIDGLDIHFLHVQSERADARPLVLSHGWPGSVVEALEVIDDLVSPGSDELPAFHVVAPSLPGFGFSGRPDAEGWNVDRTADAWAELMSRLGYERYYAVGGDWGGRVTASLGQRHRDKVAAIHTYSPYVANAEVEPGSLTEVEDRQLADTRRFWQYGGGYSLEQSTKPQTLGYGLVDSPIAQLAWILEKLHGWTDCDGHPENAVSRDRILDNVMMYWLTATGASSARFYWQNFPPERWSIVDVPTAVSVFPRDIEILPRRWVERRFTQLAYWNVVDRGGHFPMLECPSTFVAELRTSLGLLERNGSAPGYGAPAGGGE